jgi:uncharacterized protein (TIGR02453 family)
MRYVTPELFRFLNDLKRNNKKEWFEANRARYETHLKTPMLQLIGDLAKPLKKIAPRLVASQKPVGGSLMRIHRDVRFSKDKSPYKTNVGLHFRDAAGKDVHAPGIYVHFEPGDVFVGGGIWHPDPPTAGKIRDAIIAGPKKWTAARGKHTLGGDSYARPPRGVDPAHPLVEDLKRKDFIAIAQMKEKDALATDFFDRLVDEMRAVAPLLDFLSRAVS